jgi:hypothetical protein
VDFLLVFVVGCLISVFEFAFIYAVSPKQLKIQIVNNRPIVTIYTSCFFLPFTTKIREYKDLQEAYIKNRIENGKKSYYTVYDLVLRFSKETIVLFKGNEDKEELSEYCKKINHTLTSFEDCFISEPTIISKKTAVSIVLFLSPLLIFIPPKHSRNSYITDITNNFYIYLVATGILITFMGLSIIINLFINAKNNNISEYKDHNIKENTDIDAEAKRINNFIIK